MSEFKTGDKVRVLYSFQPDIDAIVIADQEDHWVMVEQITDWEDEEVRPQFLALAEMTYHTKETR